jgi:TATA-box binding protein (TBP) (component of TFIID and TFIIIB)
MSNNTWNDFKYIDYLNIKEHEINNLPLGVSISTMCASCKLNTKINIENLEKYLLLNTNDVLKIKPRNSDIKSLINDKKRKKRKNNTNEKTNNYFYNQITVVIRIDNGIFENINDLKKINLKIFQNGSIQMSGCKSVNDINIVINKLIIKLKEIKNIIIDNEIKEIKFIDNYDINVSNFKIDMINCNFKININIDRAKLYDLLKLKKISSQYEKCIRACVNIKYAPKNYNIDEKEISIFIFQKGNIIITGARNKHHIVESYNFIKDIISSHYNEINKKTEKEEESLILYIYDLLVKEKKI